MRTTRLAPLAAVLASACVAQVGPTGDRGDRDTGDCTLEPYALTLTTEADLRDIPRGCFSLDGDLVIERSTLANLDALKQLRDVRGALRIEDNGALTTLAGLADVRVAGELVIEGNPRLADLTGLDGTDELTALTLRSNPALRDLSGLRNLTEISGDVLVSNNAALASVAVPVTLAQPGVPLHGRRGAARRRVAKQPDRWPRPLGARTLRHLHPHVALGLGRAPGLLEHLHRGLVAIHQRRVQQVVAQQVDHGLHDRADRRHQRHADDPAGCDPLRFDRPILACRQSRQQGSGRGHRHPADRLHQQGQRAGLQRRQLAGAVGRRGADGPRACDRLQRRKGCRRHLRA